MYTLKGLTKTNIEKTVKLPYSKIIETGFDDEIKIVQDRLGKKIVFSDKRDLRKIGRGNPLLARRKIRTMEQINKRMTGMK